MFEKSYILTQSSLFIKKLDAIFKCIPEHTVTARHSTFTDGKLLSCHGNTVCCFFCWKLNSLPFLAHTGQVPVPVVGMKSDILLSGTSPSPSGILAESFPPGPFPSHRLSCVEASWKNRQNIDREADAARTRRLEWECVLQKGQSIKHTPSPPGRSLSMFSPSCSTGTWEISKKKKLTVIFAVSKHLRHFKMPRSLKR